MLCLSGLSPSLPSLPPMSCMLDSGLSLELEEYIWCCNRLALRAHFIANGRSSCCNINAETSRQRACGPGASTMSRIQPGSFESTPRNAAGLRPAVQAQKAQNMWHLAQRSLEQLEQVVQAWLNCLPRSQERFTASAAAAQFTPTCRCACQRKEVVGCRRVHSCIFLQRSARSLSDRPCATNVKGPETCHDHFTRQARHSESELEHLLRSRKHGRWTGPTRQQRIRAVPKKKPSGPCSALRHGISTPSSPLFTVHSVHRARPVMAAQCRGVSPASSWALTSMPIPRPSKPMCKYT